MLDNEDGQSTAIIDGASATDATSESSRHGEREGGPPFSVGAAESLLDRETASKGLYNVLTLIQACDVPARDQRADEAYTTYRRADVDEMRRLLRASINKANADAIELRAVRRNLALTEAELRRSERMQRAPSVAAITRMGTFGPDVLVVALSDGSIRRYHPTNPVGHRFEDMDDVPTTRAAIAREEIVL